MDKKTIGTNAGIIWGLLSNNEKWDISRLAHAAGLAEKDIYAAIGWLARENKIEIEEGPVHQDNFYLVIEYYF